MQYYSVRTTIAALGVAFVGFLAPTTAEAVQAQVRIDCGTSTTAKTFPSSTAFFGTSITSTTSVNFGTAVANGVYTHPDNANCKFKVVGTAQFTADASKVGQLLLNNFSAKNIGTLNGSVRIDYRHQNRSADPNTAQCVSLSADGFFYNVGGTTTGDRFDLTMTVIYHKSGNVFRTFRVGKGADETPTTPATIGTCSTTAGSDLDGLIPNGVMSYIVVNDAFFNPQNPPQVFNRIPACTGCTTGTGTTAGARIEKAFDIMVLPVQHEISSIATVRGGMAEQAANNSTKEQEREAAANQLLKAANASDCARIDHKPGQSNNFLQNSGDQGHILVDLLGGPCFDVTLVDIDSLLLFAGTSGLDDNTDAGTEAGDFHGDGAGVVQFSFGDFNHDGFTDIRLKFDQGELVVGDFDDRVQVRGFIDVDGEDVEFRAEDSAIVQ